MPKRRTGFTLIELLVGIAIIAVLIAPAPACGSRRRRARRAAAGSNASTTLEADGPRPPLRIKISSGSFPTTTIRFIGDPTLHRLRLWGDVHVPIHEMLPQLEQGPLYNAINFTYQYSPYGQSDVAGVPVNSTAAGALVGVFVCPSDRMGIPGISGYGAGRSGVIVPDSNYMANAGTKIVLGNTWGASFGAGPTTAGSDDGAMTEYHAVKLSEFGDGTSNTILLGEWGRGPLGIGNGDWLAAGGDGVQRVTSVGINRRYAEPLPFAARMPEVDNTPQQGMQSGVGFGSNHPGGANFAFADGSVKFLKSTTDLRVLSGLGTRAGGEVISASDY